MTSDPRTMDAHLQGNPQLHYGVKRGTGQSARPGEDDALQFLSQEEQECLQFFEKTIDSLEESLEENDRRKLPTSSSHPAESVSRPPTSNPIVSSLLARHPSPKDQDIIYLVRPEPDLVQTKELFSPTNPDFQSMRQIPESHFEIKPRRDTSDGLPTEYNPPLPSGSYGATDSPSSYHPPGCIPTPVLIAQQIADIQVAGTSSVPPSPIHHSGSQESEKQSPFADPAVKQGPPTSTKPTRFPANINMILGNREHQNQQPGNVNIQERRAQMLANLTGTPSPLLQEDQQAMEDKARNIPTRSISFKDPSPDKSRMEALSKLGLTRNRAMSGGVALLAIPNSTPVNPPPDAEISARPLEASASPTVETTAKLPEAVSTTPLQVQVDKKTEIPRTDSPKPNKERSHPASPSSPAVPRSSNYPPPMESKAVTRSSNYPPPMENKAVTRSSNYPPPMENKAVTRSSNYPPPMENKASLPPPSEVTLPEINSYGGKSIMVHRSVPARRESTTPINDESKILPTTLANPTEFNTYGGKSKVMNPAPVPVARSNLPDILSSHIDKTQTLPTRSDPLHTELNNYGGKSRTFNPSSGLNRPPSQSQTRSFKAPAPTPAPRPPRQSYHGTTQKPALQVLHPEHKRRSNSMFRPQGITVQFSGRGATDESRKDALRKLGLLKDS